ncbi:MAG: aldo/keto reductase [Phreatobacter sp.]|uniref:aldo/keto reductase n=1 Tax=Phreatobacter sp. TaxID=1966341 RepID=UPI001A616617|nr:aldo/keto reductase [Phreatobacter sp.]MBL8571833.1 aldo/keto reductase [Phreatobacter sp.]
MDPTTRRRIGRTKLEVTAFGFGAAPIGGFRATIPEDQASATVWAAHKAGTNFYDTSPFYGYGRSELRLGSVLRQLPRDSFVLSTKIGRWMRPMKPGEVIANLRPNGLPFAPTFDYSYDGVMRSLEHSLLRLGLARVDILFIHDVDFWSLNDRDLLEKHFKQAMDGGYRALDELRRAGTISAIGCGLNDAGMCARFARAGDFDCMLLAGRYTLLEQAALDEFMPLAEKKDISVVIGGPYNSGILTGNVKPGAKYDYADAPEAILERARRLEAVCRRHDVPLAAAAIQFPLAHPAVAAVIPGALNPQEIEQNVAHLRRAIPAALWQELRHEKLIDPAAPVPA